MTHGMHREDPYIDGHAIGVTLSTGKVELYMLCPHHDTIPDSGPVPPCRIVYDDETKTPTGEWADSCQLIRMLQLDHVGDHLSLPVDMDVDVTTVPFDVCWWWDFDARTVLWAPIVETRSVEAFGEQ